MEVKFLYCADVRKCIKCEEEGSKCFSARQGVISHDYDCLCTQVVWAGVRTCASPSPAFGRGDSTLPQVYRDVLCFPESARLTTIRQQPRHETSRTPSIEYPVCSAYDQSQRVL